MLPGDGEKRDCVTEIAEHPVSNRGIVQWFSILFML